MRITLNDYIKLLKKHSKQYGNCEILSLGCCCGEFEGLLSPHTVHLTMDGGLSMDKTLYISSQKVETLEAVTLLRLDEALEVARQEYRQEGKSLEGTSELELLEYLPPKLFDSTFKVKKVIDNYIIVETDTIIPETWWVNPKFVKKFSKNVHFL